MGIIIIACFHEEEKLEDSRMQLMRQVRYEIAKGNGENLVVTRSRVFGALRDCPVHFIIGNSWF